MTETDAAFDFSVIICTYAEERWEDLCSCLASVHSQSRPAREVIVIVDHNPALRDKAQAALPGVVVADNTERWGLSGARNQGIKLSKGAILAFLDDDAVAAPDWLDQLHSGFTDPTVMGVGGSILPQWEAEKPGWFPEEFTWVVGCTYLGMPESKSPVRNLIGANMCFRRQVFQQAGYFSVEMGRVGALPAGCEETELCIRIQQVLPESKLVYQPLARVFHRVPASRARWPYFRARCYHEGFSKALVTRFVGARQGLSSERAYTFRTLPRGIFLGLSHALIHRDPQALARAGAILAGLSITTIGYLAGRFSQRRESLKPLHRMNNPGQET